MFYTSCVVPHLLTCEHVQVTKMSKLPPLKYDVRAAAAQALVGMHTYCSTSGLGTFREPLPMPGASSLFVACIRALVLLLATAALLLPTLRHMIGALEVQP